MRPWSVSGPDIVTRTGHVAADALEADVDAIRMDGVFDLAFYRQLARDGFSNGTGYQPIQRDAGAADLRAHGG